VIWVNETPGEYTVVVGCNPLAQAFNNELGDSYQLGTLDRLLCPDKHITKGLLRIWVATFPV